MLAKRYQDQANGYIYEIASLLELGVAGQREHALIVWRHREQAETAPVVSVIPPGRADRGAVESGAAEAAPDGGDDAVTVYAEKLLPHDIEAEEAVLGSLLIDGECMPRLSSILKPSDFYRERNQLCFDAAMALFQRDQAIDQLTLAGELARTEKLDAAGGMAYLSHVVSITPTSVHAEDYANAVWRTSRMRQLIDAGVRITALGYNDTDDVVRTMRDAEDILFGMKGLEQRRGFVPLKDIYDDYLQAEAQAADPRHADGMPIMTGFTDLDELLGGMQRADMVILGARPSIGKSTLAVNMAVTPPSWDRSAAY